MPSRDTIGIAIVGAGMIAEYHQRAIETLDCTHLVSIAHYKPEKFDELGQRFGVPCTTLERVLADSRVDAVIVCSPSGLHAEQAIAAAKAGKHVLVEKPMALTVADADRMIAACDCADVNLGVVLQRRLSEEFESAHKAIRGGELGELTMGVVSIPYYRPMSYYHQAEWRGTWNLDGGGVLMNQGIHLVDLLVWFMGTPVDVQAYASTIYQDIEVEDTLAAVLRFEDGAMATIAATVTAKPGFPHRVEIYGTKGGIQFEGDTICKWQMVGNRSLNMGCPSKSTSTSAGPGAAPHGIDLSGHMAVVSEFAESIRNRRQSKPNGREGRRSLELVEAIYNAAGIRH